MLLKSESIETEVQALQWGICIFRMKDWAQISHENVRYYKFPLNILVHECSSPFLQHV